MAGTQTTRSIEEKLARVRQAYEALQSGQVDGLVDSMADDIVLHSQGAGKDLRGKAAVTQWGQELLRRGDHFKFHDACASEAHAVALLEVTAANGERQRLVNILHHNDQGLVNEAWTLAGPA